MSCGGQESLVTSRESGGRESEGRSPEGDFRLSVSLLIIFAIMHN